jgi:hypothetical protein
VKRSMDMVHMGKVSEVVVITAVVRATASDRSRATMGQTYQRSSRPTHLDSLLNYSSCGRLTHLYSLLDLSSVHDPPAFIPPELLLCVRRHTNLYALLDYCLVSRPPPAWWERVWRAVGMTPCWWAPGKRRGGVGWGPASKGFREKGGGQSVYPRKGKGVWGRGGVRASPER